MPIDDGTKGIQLGKMIEEYLHYAGIHLHILTASGEISRGRDRERKGMKLLVLVADSTADRLNRREWRSDR